MSEEHNNWTIYTLKTFLLAIIEANDKRYAQNDESTKVAMQAALAAADRAVAKAEIATEKRFDSVNEFRGLVNDLVSKLMPKAEADLQLKALSEKIDILMKDAASTKSKKLGMAELWGYIIGSIGILSLIVTVITLVLKH